MNRDSAAAIATYDQANFFWRTGDTRERGRGKRRKGKTGEGINGGRGERAKGKTGEGEKCEKEEW